jgi:hypothetical protein
MVLQGIPTLFKNATVADFRLEEGDTAIRNKNTLYSQTFKLDDGSEVSPSVDPQGFTFEINEDKLTLTFDTLNFTYTPNIEGFIKFTSNASFVLDKGNKIQLQMQDGSTAGSGVTTKTGVLVAEITSGIALMVAGAILGFCLPGEGEVAGEVGAVAVDGNHFALNTLTATVTADEGGIGAAVEGGNGTLQAVGEMGAAIQNEMDVATEVPGWFARNWKKLGIVVGSAMLGGAIPSIEQLIEGDSERSPREHPVSRYAREERGEGDHVAERVAVHPDVGDDQRLAAARRRSGLRGVAMAKRITRRMRESKCRLRQQKNARAVPSGLRPAAFAAMPAAPPVGDEASTYGWDTAFAIRVADVNAAIEKAGTSPTSFAYEEPDHSCSIKGEFGPWRIGPGGDGKLIHLHIPIPSGELTMSTPTAITGATAEVEVLLHFLPHGGANPSANGVDHDLIVQTTVDEGDEKVATVTDLYFDDPAHALGMIHKAVARGASKPG